MKTEIINQEILLFTYTSFAKRELYDWDNTDCNENKNSADQLEKACWSGLVFEILPDIFNSNEQKSMYVWKVNLAEQFLHVTLGSTPSLPEDQTSIDPYSFLGIESYYN